MQNIKHLIFSCIFSIFLLLFWNLFFSDFPQCRKSEILRNGTNILKAYNQIVRELAVIWGDLCFGIIWGCLICWVELSGLFIFGFILIKIDHYSNTFSQFDIISESKMNELAKTNLPANLRHQRILLNKNVINFQ